MLYNGEQVGNGSPPAVDIAVDPVDGTTLTAKALPDALAVIAVADRGTMFDPGPCVYMEKLAVSRRRGRRRRLRGADRGHAGADRQGARHARRRPHGGDPRSPAPRRPGRARAEHGRADQVPARRRRRRARSWAADESTAVDVLVGIGGTPEGVIAACAMKCLDGAIFGQALPARRRRAPGGARRRATTSTRCSPPTTWSPGATCFFAATGVTDGELLRGVRYTPRRVFTQSLSMRSKSGAVRLIEGRHHSGGSNLAGP